ncbi:cell division protein ZapC [Vibrio sp. HA2012]|uniref:cell division protein ZapC n=1 Tax=Vibrio sp. HA2012 TaxID=1971595 RepID=UPI000C2C8FD2|nr:cell division protein ZapC [Vibrio sp. HA2012]PJC87951.1 cell division protein ZapC [Vibrio sp. HA2012]
MLKPKDTWNWYFDRGNDALMLDLGEDMLFRVNLPKKFLVDCAFSANDFSVEDATSFQIFREQISRIDLSEPRRAELVLNCVAAKRFHVPVQPKSWFFDYQPEGKGYEPEEGDFIHLQNGFGEGYFMVIECGETASLCAYVELGEFQLNGSKRLCFGEPIKVMHDRMLCANAMFTEQPIALVG